MTISEFLESKNITQEDFAAFTGIPRGRIAFWIRENRTAPPKVEDATIYEKTVSFLSNKTPEQVAGAVKNYRYILGNFEPVEGYNETISTGIPVPPDENKNLIPFYDLDIMAGTQDLYNDTFSMAPSYYLDIPTYAGCKAFPVYSDSMAPLITPGSIIFIKPVHNWRDILEYGQIYTIQLSDYRRFLKYIRKSTNKENFTARSHNPEYDDFEVPKNLINNIAIVEGWMLKKTQ